MHNNRNINIVMNMDRMNDTTDECGDRMMVQMYFHTGYCEYILFQQLQTDSKAEMIAACIAVFLVSLLLEGIKASREYLLSNAVLQSVSPSTNYASEPKIVVPRRNKILSNANFLQTLLYALQIFMSYCLMVIFMTLNIWLCTAVVMGAAVGHFLFGWMRNTIGDSSEHCR